MGLLRERSPPKPFSTVAQPYQLEHATTLQLRQKAPDFLGTLVSNRQV